MKITKDCNGMTLVEVIAAGAILVIVSLTAVTGFETAQRLMHRGRCLARQDQEAEYAIEKGRMPERQRNESIRLRLGKRGSWISMDIVINEFSGNGLCDEKMDFPLRTFSLPEEVVEEDEELLEP